MERVLSRAGIMIDRHTGKEQSGTNLPLVVGPWRH